MSEQLNEQVDERVAMAISHWAPRFTMNGVTAGDFERITSGLASWDDWCAAWSAVAAEHERLGRDALAAGREMSAGAHLSQAAVYYHFAKFLFVNDPGQMRAASPAPQIQARAEHAALGPDQDDAGPSRQQLR